MRRSGLERVRASERDGTTLLTIYVVLLTAIPARYVVGPLGAAGTPAQLFAICLAIWWVGNRLARPFTVSPATQPVRRAMLVFGLAVLASYVVATVRPIEGAELRAADRGLLTVLSWTGVILVAGDGIPTRERLDVLLRRLSRAVAGVAGLGLLQFVTGVTFTNYLQLPGLTENGDLGFVAARSGFLRPAGTALHPIEFGVVLTMGLPIALHYALRDRDRPRLVRLLPVALIAAAIPITVSRSAIVCSTVAVVLMLPAMPRSARRVTYAAIVFLLGAVYLLVPGLLGTLTGLFSGIGSDTSAASRTGSYDIALQFVARSPVFGRGFATFLPDYRILDNEFLGTLIETGLFGLAALLCLFLTGMWTARRVNRTSDDVVTVQLARAVLASVAAGAISYAFFDAFAFPMMAGLMFLVLGVSGALYRISMTQAVAGGAVLGLQGMDVSSSEWRYQVRQDVAPW